MIKGIITKTSIFILNVILSSFISLGLINSFNHILDHIDYSYNENGLVYQEGSFDYNGKQKYFYAAYNSVENKEYEWVIHSIRNEIDTTLSTVLDIAKNYEEVTGKKVLFGSNGDYFYATGSNVDTYVKEGIVLSKGNYSTKHCIGFDNEGNVAIGRLTETNLNICVNDGLNNTFFTVNSINKESNEGVMIYTTPGTYTILNSYKFVCNTKSANLSQYPVFGKSRLMKKAELVNDDSFTLKSGQFAVVVRGEDAQFFYDNVTYDTIVNIVERPGGDYLDLKYVVGGYDILVNNGELSDKFHTDNSGNVAAPRTLIGIKEDGTIFVAMVDGRQSGYAIGLTVEEEASLAYYMGAKYALELDGGGSTTCILRIDDELVLRNKPSDGSMRKVSNAVLLVEKDKEEPVDPVEPVEPTEPIDPVDPVDPVEPVDPIKPADPVEPIIPKDDKKLSKTSIIIISASSVSFVSISGLVIIILLRKKRLK